MQNGTHDIGTDSATEVPHKPQEQKSDVLHWQSARVRLPAVVLDAGVESADFAGDLTYEMVGCSSNHQPIRLNERNDLSQSR